MQPEAKISNESAYNILIGIRICIRIPRTSGRKMLFILLPSLREGGNLLKLKTGPKEKINLSNSQG